MLIDPRDLWNPEVVTAIVVLCATTLIASVNEMADKPVAQPRTWDSNKVVRAKEIFAFEEYEKKASQYRMPITNWNPVFVECDGVTNFQFMGESGGDAGSTRGYRGSDRDRWIDIKIHSFKSRRAAHEYMVSLMSDPPIGQPSRDSEVTDPKKTIGDRSFMGAFRDIIEQILFIRNNYCIVISGKGVKVETLARDLDRQILELSKGGPKEKQ